MKSDNGVFDPLIVGGGFLVMSISAVLCGAAALKILFTDFNRPPQVVKQDVQTTDNRCLMLCRAGGENHE